MVSKYQNSKIYINNVSRFDRQNSLMSCSFASTTCQGLTNFKISMECHHWGCSWRGQGIVERGQGNFFMTTTWKLHPFANHDMICLEYVVEDDFGISKCVLTEMKFVTNHNIFTLRPLPFSPTTIVNPKSFPFSPTTYKEMR